MAHRPEEGPKGAGGSQAVRGLGRSGRGRRGRARAPVPRPPAATVWLKGEKTPAPSRPLQRLLGVRGSAGGRAPSGGSEPGPEVSFALYF